MWPLAETKPKHLLPIAGKPILGRILGSLAEAGLRDVVIVVGFQEEAIRHSIGDGSAYNLRVEYVRQPARTGTASALQVAYDAIGRERFLAIYGDLVIAAGAVRDLLEKAEDWPRVMGIVRMEDVSQYGLIRLDGDSVVKIDEKPAAMIGKPGWVNTGMYVLDEDVFHAVEETSRSKRAEVELTSSLQLLIRKGKGVKAAFINESSWMDIGRPWDLLIANERVLDDLNHRVAGTVETGALLKGSVFVEEGALIRSGSYVEGPVYCGRGSKIGPNARIRPYTSLESDVVVGASCDIKNSIVMSTTKIPHLSYVGDSIIGEDCNLGAGTITANVRFDKRTVRMRIKGRLHDSGRVKLGAIVGDRVQTGINVTLLPGIRIGSGSWVAPGAIVSHDIRSRTLVLVKQTQISKDITGVLRKAKRHV